MRLLALWASFLQTPEKLLDVVAHVCEGARQMRE
jgi:hypothetical protein